MHFPSLAASNMVPDYEVKLLLDPDMVLGSDHKLTPTVLSTFAMPTKVTKMNVQFLDTSTEEIYNTGWSPRLRKIEGVADFEETYKKRYAITGGDIDAALTTANNEGFDSDTTKYDAQIEWGYQKLTLSISRGMDLPGTSRSRTLMINDAPDKFDNWLFNNWGTDALAVSRIFGPVFAKRSIGTWSGLKLYIEVWPIIDAAGTGTEYIVEASFKTTSRTTALSKHDGMIAFLQGKGWFLAQDSLKTQLIMDRY
ncbi:uncharacterized protein K444DRAFT_706710 [Hyaloscypha bicolor E]|uniref:Uncharacterized protein n=1 Tax=Hyaloscypha bicolor E TaxID=1095630 RepID=A0A2J6SJQ1_9HELO|nr:uncharacterized protein K444DRAFT_706710 [Hyaloscypha bicolor E]PMD50970.1 hypothetical protein K444DRAFT_706710 [Hyaloscypha bicolor E]